MKKGENGEEEEKKDAKKSERMQGGERDGGMKEKLD